MKILHVLRAPTGGLWRHVVDLSVELAARGHDIGIAMDGGFSDIQTKSGLERLAGLTSLGIHRVPINRQPGLSDIGAALYVRQLAARLDAQVVHGHGAKGGLYARAAVGGVTGRVCAYTPHGGVLNYGPGSLSGGLFRKFETLLLGMTDAIVFESDFARQSYFKQIGVPKHHWAVVHNGLGASDFMPVEPDSEPYDFVFIGELRPVKGIPFLIDALTRVKRADGGQATLILAGDGPDGPAIREQIERLGLADHVLMAGVQPARKMLARADCVVIPSLAESLPYVVLEAAAAGKQVISTRIGGIGEIFGPSADRLLPPGDVEALRNAMQKFLDDPVAADREAAARRLYVKEQFSLSRMTDGVARIYRAALGQEA